MFLGDTVYIAAAFCGVSLQ